jgi:anti-anti-sigma regulatory factor/putative methionine-R-sulfoxide reductase with GAF domain
MLTKLPATNPLAQALKVQEADLVEVEASLDAILRGTAIFALVIGIGALFPVLGVFGPSLTHFWLVAGASWLLFGVAWGLRRLNQRGFVSEAINLFLVAITLYVSLVPPPGLLLTGPVIAAYALPIVGAVLLIGAGASWIWVGIATLAILIRARIDANVAGMAVGLMALISGVIMLCLLAWCSWFLGRSVHQAKGRLRQQISQSRTGVEIGHMVTSATEVSTIVERAVQMIQGAFEYYHVGLYTRDHETNQAVLMDAAGEGAAFLKEKGMRVSLSGTTAVAAAINQERRVMVTSWQDSRDARGNKIQFTYERFLSRVELVIPLRVGDRVLGVLDIHRKEMEAFSEDDMHVLEGLAGNIGNALEGVLHFQDRIQAAEALEQAYAEIEQRVEERTAELERETAEREHLQQEMIEAQQRAIRELSTPIIPIMDSIIIVPLIGSIDAERSRDITRSLLAGVREHQARVVIMDITGMPLVDSGAADYLDRTIQAARLKGAHTIVTGISSAVAETIVDLGIDWAEIETRSDLQTGLRAALARVGQRIVDS